jgi:hypothetical protein
MHTKRMKTQRILLHKKNIIYIVIMETVIISGNRETDLSTQIQNVSC